MNKEYSSFLKEEAGLTLTEILVTLFLIGLIFVSANFSGLGEGDHLKEAASTVERAMRYASSEAILKNRILRLKINLNSAPQEYVIEEGPSSSFTLPSSLYEENNEDLSLKDQEEKSKKKSEHDKQFQLITDFNNGPKKFHPSIRLVGAGTVSTKKIISSGEVSIYVFPSGERDNALLIFANNKEIISVDIPAFKNKFNLTSLAVRSSQENSFDSMEALLERQDELAEQLFEEWMSK